MTAPANDFVANYMAFINAKHLIDAQKREIATNIRNHQSSFLELVAKIDSLAAQIIHLERKLLPAVNRSFHLIAMDGNFNECKCLMLRIELIDANIEPSGNTREFILNELGLELTHIPQLKQDVKRLYAQLSIDYNPLRSRGLPLR